MKPEGPGRVLMGLARARRTATLYGADHPVTAEILSEVVEALRPLLAGRSPLSLVLQEEVFRAGKMLLLDETLRLSVLPSVLRDRGIGAIEFREGVSHRDLQHLIDLFITPPRRVQQAGGAEAVLRERGVRQIVVSAGPPAGARPGDGPRIDPADVYHAGLHVVVDLYAQASRDAPLDVRKATVLIVSLLDALRENRTGLQTMGAARIYDEASAHHPMHVAALALLMGLELGLERPVVIAAGLAALLHDIGHAHVPWEILTGSAAAGAGASGRAMQDHAFHGAFQLRGLPGLSRLAMVVAFEHHAYRDGSGYPPLGAGAALHPLTRLVQVADFYDAATASTRADRPPMPPQDALRFIRDGAGRFFDAEAAGALDRVVGRLPVAG